MAESLFSASACNFIKKETLVQVFSCEFCEIFMNIYFEEHLGTTASGFMFFIFLKPYSYNSTTTSNHNNMTCMQDHFTQSITLSWIRCSVKKVFLELSQNLQKNTCASLFFQPQACNFFKKETLAKLFSFEFCEISKNTFSYRTPPVAAFKNHQNEQKKDKKSLTITFLIKVLKAFLKMVFLNTLYITSSKSIVFNKFL